MPPRTNDFQELATLIHQALQPTGAKVTPSSMEQTDIDFREVDVLIESPCGPFAMKIAVEAKDKGRPMDRVDFDSIKGKYTGEGRVPVDRVVVVTRSGYTDAVVRLARKLRFELFTLDEAREIKWPWLCPMPWSSDPKPRPLIIHIEPIIPAEALRGGTVFCVEHAKDHGKVQKFVETAMFGQIAKTRRGFLYEIIGEALNFGEACRRYSVIPDHAYYLQHDGNKFAIERVSFDVVSRYEQTTLVWRTLRLAQEGGPERDVVVADADFGPGKSKQRLVMPDGFKAPKIVMEAYHPWLSPKPLVFEMNREGPEPVVQADGSMNPPTQWKSQPVFVEEPAPQQPATSKKKPRNKGKAGD